MVIVAALAELGPLVVAGAFLLLLYAASWILVKPIQALLRQLPFIGGNIADAIGGLTDWIIGAIQDELDRRVTAFGDMVDFVTGSIQYVLNTATDAIELIFGALRGLQTAATGIQRQLQQTINDLSRDVDRALRDAGRGLTRAVAVAADLAAAVANVIPRMIDQAVAAVRSFVRGIQHDLQRELDNAVGLLRDTIVGLIASQLAGIRSWVSSLITQVQRALQELEADLGRRIRALEHDVGHRLDGLATDLEGLQKLIGVIPAATIATWIGTIAAELTRIKTECVMPSCSYLGPQLDALNAIQDVATTAIIAGLVAAAVTDPEGAARAIGDTLSGADDLARELFGATTGVHV